MKFFTIFASLFLTALTSHAMTIRAHFGDIRCDLSGSTFSISVSNSVVKTYTVSSQETGNAALAYCDGIKSQASMSQRYIVLIDTNAELTSDKLFSFEQACK